MSPTKRIAISGIVIEVPTEPPSPDQCPLQSRIECSYGLWTIEVWRDGERRASFGPESFTTALVRALMREDLGDVVPDQVVLRWED
ncbi:hypothetical protein CPCC7001_1840 [Cyanobium sp. PCC 7001]|uniref:hypothetical protein n=1 Tax=Cyanobium sp. PCC 7001 TaxID=180281 RepID=UPI00018057E4|nr:hypothetical protein [Cyanobium sp. PCC 7001]EDY38961.1 hypothetical protein CPCC7001_1840 [Cyanobium sp. PCC 7001]